MNPNKALWEKGDFTRIARNDARQRRGAGRVDRRQARHEGARPRLRRRHHRDSRRRRLGADVLGVDIARNLVEAGNRRAQEAGPHEPAASRRATRPTCSDLAGQTLRPRRQHLRRDVRAEAVRRREGDGARDPARRPHRDGQLDPERPDAGRADPEDQLGLLAAAAGGLRQPDDLGRREPRARALRRRRRPEGRRSPARATPSRSTSTARRPSSSPSSATTTGRR